MNVPCSLIRSTRAGVAQQHRSRQATTPDKNASPQPAIRKVNPSPIRKRASTNDGAAPAAGVMCTRARAIATMAAFAPRSGSRAQMDANTSVCQHVSFVNFAGSCACFVVVEHVQRSTTQFQVTIESRPHRAYLLRQCALVSPPQNEMRDLASMQWCHRKSQRISKA